MLNTAQLRVAWAPACTPANIVGIELVQGIVVQVHKDTRAAVKALGRVFESHGYVVRRGDTGAYNCRAITGGIDRSLHAFGVAIDVNWSTNAYRADNKIVTDMPPQMIGDIKRIETTSGKRVWRWGGEYVTVKDAMHFEVCCSPVDLRTGIAWQTVQQTPALYSHPLLVRGDRGPAVERLHDLLRLVNRGEPGYGVFGPRTEAAVREYQASRGLTADGRVGRQTWTALLYDQPPVAPDEPGPVKRQTTQE